MNHVAAPNVIILTRDDKIKKIAGSNIYIYPCTPMVEATGLSI